MKDFLSYKNSDDMIKAMKVEPLNDYRLRVWFSNGEVKIFDFKPKLEFPAFAPLKNKSFFASVKTRKGTAFWSYNWGNKNFANDIDIAPERLYSDGVPE